MNLFDVFGLAGQTSRDYDGKLRENTNFFEGTLSSTPNARPDIVAENLKLIAQKIRGTKAEKRNGNQPDIFLVGQFQYVQGVFIGAYGYNESLNIFEVLLEPGGEGKYTSTLS